MFCKKIILKILQNSQKNVFVGVPFLIKLLAGYLKLSEAATGDVLEKKVLLKRRTDVSEPAVHRSSTQNRCFWKIHKIHSKKLVLESLFNKSALLRACNFIQEDPNTGAFLWNLKTLKKNYFEEDLRTSASKHYLKKETRTQVLSREFCELFKNIYFLEDLQMASSETPVRGSFFNKVANLTTWRLRKRLPHSYLSVNFEKFLGELFLRNTS